MINDNSPMSGANTKYVKTEALFPGSPIPEHDYVGRAWYLFSHEHGVTEKGQNFQNRRSTFYTHSMLNAQCVGYLLCPN